MRKSGSVTCVGEALVDFVSTRSGVTLADAPGFLKTIGGEGANVAVGLARLGTPVFFVGKLGGDSFGVFLYNRLKREGVDTSGVRFDREYGTRLAFVSLAKGGDRDFEFWEKHPAGERLRYSDVDINKIRKSTIVNIAPLLLKKEPSRSSALRIAREARRRGCHVAFDANVRLSLWKSPTEARRVLLQMVNLCSILRLNAEEAKFLTGRGDIKSTAHLLRRKGPLIVVVTLGKKGCFFQAGEHSGYVKGFHVKPVDTTGCGDGFFAAMLHHLAGNPLLLDGMSAQELHEMCVYANAVGALTSLARGGAASMPYPKEVDKFIRKHRTT